MRAPAWTRKGRNLRFVRVICHGSGTYAHRQPGAADSSKTFFELTGMSRLANRCQSLPSSLRHARLIVRPCPCQPVMLFLKKRLEFVAHCAIVKRGGVMTQYPAAALQQPCVGHDLQVARHVRRPDHPAAHRILISWTTAGAHASIGGAIARTSQGDFSEAQLHQSHPSATKKVRHYLWSPMSALNSW